MASLTWSRLELFNRENAALFTLFNILKLKKIKRNLAAFINFFIFVFLKIVLVNY